MCDSPLNLFLIVTMHIIVWKHKLKVFDNESTRNINFSDDHTATYVLGDEFFNENVHKNATS